MAYRTLLVPLLRDRDADAALAPAVELAERHGAHLTGLHFVPPADLATAYGVYGVALSPTDGRAWAAERRERADRLRARFEAATAAVDVVAEWREVHESGSAPEVTLAAIGNASDLVLLALDEDPARRARRGGIAARVLLRCAHPAMLVPPGCDPTGVGRRVFVAWDGERASTRALFGALPLMRRAEAVRLERFNLPVAERRGALCTTEELAGTLSRHGVELERHAADVAESAIGAELLGYARDWGADTIVAGAYERGAFRESLFGSTTRDLLRRAAVPVVMSV